MDKKREKEFLENIFPKNKKGQFFLIAAIVIIAVVVGVVTISNYVEKKDDTRLYDLGKELNIESRSILDYGTYQQLNETEMKEMMENFIQNYVNYIGEAGNLYFIFGNKERVYVIGYQQIGEETVCIKLDPDNNPKECLTVEAMGETQEFPSPTNKEMEDIVVKIETTEYRFKLLEGENFYFVIWQKTQEGEKIVIKSTDVK